MSLKRKDYLDYKIIKGHEDDDIAQITTALKDFSSISGLYAKRGDELTVLARKMYHELQDNRLSINVLHLFIDKYWTEICVKNQTKAPNYFDFRVFVKRYITDTQFKENMQVNGFKGVATCPHCDDKYFLETVDLLTDELSATRCTCFGEPYFDTIDDGNIYFIKQGYWWVGGGEQEPFLTEENKAQVLKERGNLSRVWFDEIQKNILLIHNKMCGNSENSEISVSSCCKAKINYHVDGKVFVAWCDFCKKEC